jgi:hypothetical protein
MRKYRNLTAVKAWFRNSAGAMKNRSEKRQSNKDDWFLREIEENMPEDFDIYDETPEELGLDNPWSVIELKDVKKDEK